MLTETELFFESIRDKDRSVLEFLDADYTFVNERLARHYGIAGVSGDWFRRVSLAGTPRGGVLTQASVLAATSNPNRTSPVKRGKWILENILGTPPSPPPSGVEALKEGRDNGHAGTLRQRMERHRTDPACAALPPPHGPAGFRTGKLRRHRRLASRTKRADRSIRRAGCRAAGLSRLRPS